ncbi:MAG: anti-sigma factor family protein, partial [Spirochaeta sp.]
MSISREQEMISAYLDGEIPDPWRSRIPEFIEADAHRADTLKRFRKVKDVLQSIPEEDIESAQERVWNSLQKRVANHPTITV